MLGRAGYVDGALGGSLGSEQWEESGYLGGSYELLWYLEEDLSGMGMYHCLYEDDWCSRLMCGGASQELASRLLSITIGDAGAMTVSLYVEIRLYGVIRIVLMGAVV